MSWCHFLREHRRTWTIAGPDPKGLARQVAAFRDEDDSRELARHVSHMLDFKLGRVRRLDDHVRQYFESLPATPRGGFVFDALAKLDLVPAKRPAIADHVASYQLHLEAKGSKALSVKLVIDRVRAVLAGCKATDWADVTGNGVTRFIQELVKAGDMVNTCSGTW